MNTKRLVCVLLRRTPKGLCICWAPLPPSLEHYGVTGCSLTWFRNYLTARSQTVQYEKELSSSLPLDFGVPLSSLLGPLLFVIDINDLPQCLVHSAIKLYADDTVMYYTGSDFSIIRENLKEDLKRVEYG